jgi:GDP-4-dehydro-6-deoxy-D-mannose reductase
LEVVGARIFNLIGPGLPTSQAFGAFAAGLCARDPDPLTLSVGDLDSRRDFVDVRDVARALTALATLGQPGLVYHVGTGCSHRVGDGLDRLIHLSGRAVNVVVRPDQVGMRGPIDSRADIRRIVEHTGWRPEISWEQSLEDLWSEASARLRLPLTGVVGPV